MCVEVSYGSLYLLNWVIIAIIIFFDTSKTLDPDIQKI